jgi:hypothetical protein
MRRDNFFKYQVSKKIINNRTNTLYNIIATINISMQLKKITIGIILYGYHLYIKYLAFVKEKNSVNTFYPLGKELYYFIDHNFEVTYQSIPVIMYHSNHNIEIFEELKLDIIFNFLTDKLVKSGKKLYHDDGISIQYVSQEPVISQDDRIVSLIKKKPPKQDSIRILIDISDQLYDHNPRVDIQLSFYLEGRYTNGVAKKIKFPFFIQQTKTFMQFKYDEKNIYFFNQEIGGIKYDIKTGDFVFNLKDQFRLSLIDKFLLNYNDVNKKSIKISLMAMEINANYRSLIYN